jgi:hypothetical protein
MSDLLKRIKIGREGPIEEAVRRLASCVAPQHLEIQGAPGAPDESWVVAESHFGRPREGRGWSRERAWRLGQRLKELASPK